LTTAIPKQHVRHLGRIRSEHAFADRQGTAKRFLCAIRMVCSDMNLGDADEAGGDAEMIGSEMFLGDVD
jgi:hypothetical protein